MHVGHARVEFLTQELTHIVTVTVEAEVRSSTVSVERLRKVFSKVTLQKMIKPMEPPLDPTAEGLPITQHDRWARLCDDDCLPCVHIYIAVPNLST